MLLDISYIHPKILSMVEKQFLWEPFQDKGGKFGNYKVSVMSTKRRTGGLGFLSGFFHQESLEKFAYVLFFYDKANHRIGFTFTNDKNIPGAFKMTKERKSGSVFPSSFWTAYNLDAEQWRGKYTPKKDNDRRFGKIYYIELSEKKADEE
jgi:hypothetical protein